jgi:hypothetical protein
LDDVGEEKDKAIPPVKNPPTDEDGFANQGGPHKTGILNAAVKSFLSR